jgi:DNA-binding IclR family transcriptional regulator
MGEGDLGHPLDALRTDPYASRCALRNGVALFATPPTIHPMIQAEAGDIRSVGKAAQVLRLLGEAGVLGVTELSRRIRVHKSTVSRLLATLERHGLVARDPQSDKFSLGPAFISLAGAALQRLDLRTVARGPLERLAEQTRETVNLAILDGDQVVNIEKISSAHYIRDIGWIGRRSPLHCTATGKALVAHLLPAARRSLLGPRLKRYTPQTICHWKALETELAEVRRVGYAVGREELEPGLVALAAPIQDLGGRVTATVSASGPAFRMTRAALATYARQVMAAAAAISQALGHSRRAALLG